MKPILPNASFVLMATIALTLAACGGGGNEGSGPAMGKSFVACQPAPEKCA